MFSLERGCVWPHSLRLKIPAPTNKGNWNCLFGKIQITKGCFRYIMKSKPCNIVYPQRAAIRGFLQLTSSTALIPLQTWSCGLETQMTWLKQFGVRLLGSVLSSATFSYNVILWPQEIVMKRQWENLHEAFNTVAGTVCSTDGSYSRWVTTTVIVSEISSNSFPSNTSEFANENQTFSCHQSIVELVVDL